MWGFQWQEALRGATMILLPGEGSRNSTPEDGCGEGSVPHCGLWRGLAIPPCILPASRGLGKSKSRMGTGILLSKSCEKEDVYIPNNRTAIP